MVGKIQTLFNQYQQKYPLYTRDAIVELMLDDSVITYEMADKIKSGTSLFLLDNHFFESTNNTEIAKGVFNSTEPKPSYNRMIESTSQSKNAGDCWLLSGINALNYTDFGRQALYDAIIPDEDNSGAVTIKFKGSPLKNKEIRITAEEIDTAKKSGHFSAGDDDMIALELATEKTFNEMAAQGLAKRNDSDDIMRKEYNYRAFINGGVRTPNWSQFPMSELLGIKTDDINFYLISYRNSDNCVEEKNNILQYIAKNQNKRNMAVWCAFNPNYSNDKIHGGHAYAVKNMVYGKYVILTDSYSESTEIELPWERFSALLTDMNISSNQVQALKRVKNMLPEYYKSAQKEFDERFNIW